MNHAVNWEAIGAIGQVVGAIAVVISLIYVAREVRSSAHATQLAASRSTLDSLHRLIRQVTEHVDLAELRIRGFTDYESLEGTDLARFNSYMHGLFRIMEDVYYLNLRGIWKIHTSGMGWKQSYVRSTQDPEFRHGGIHIRIGSVGRSLRSSSISNSKQPPGRMTSSQHVYEVRLREDKRGVNLISDVLSFGGWGRDANAASNAIGYAQFYSRGKARWFPATLNST